MENQETTSLEQRFIETDGRIDGEYIVLAITGSGYERIMSVAKNLEEAATIAENLRNGGYSDVSIRRINRQIPIR